MKNEKFQIFNPSVLAWLFTGNPVVKIMGKGLFAHYFYF